MRNIGFVLLFSAIVVGLYVTVGPKSVVRVENIYKNANCRGIWFTKLGTCAEISWVNGPVVGKNNEFLVRLTRGKRRFDRGLRMQAEPWMPAMGHGAPPTQRVQLIDQDFDGRSQIYKVSSMSLNMTGNWDIYLTLEDGGLSEEARFGFNF